jgi:predicted dehydrogenase
MTTRKLPSRRDALKRGVAAAGAVAFPMIVPASALGRDGAVAPSERITVACIGVGRQGTGDMKKFLQKRPSQVVAVCDVNQLNLGWAEHLVNERYGNQDCKTYVDFRDVVTRDDVDAVMIATPHHWHVPMAIAAAKAGMDMYCEKPMGMAAAWDWELQKVVRRYGIVFQFGTQQRSDPRFKQACRLVREGKLGEVKHVRVWCPNRDRLNLPTRPEKPPEWVDHDLWIGPALEGPYGDRPDTAVRSDRSLGMISEWGVHMLDIVNMAGLHHPETGIALEGAGQWSRDGGWDDCPINYDVLMEYGNGVKVEFKSEGMMPDYWKSRYVSEPERDRSWGHGVVFEGSEGWVHVDRESINAHPKSLLDDEEPSGPDHVQNFLDCAKSREAPAADIDAAVEADLLAHLAYIAVQTGYPLRFDAKARRFERGEMANRMLGRAMRSPWRT